MIEKKKVLRPGMYVRTRDGYIRHIIDIIFPRSKNPEWFLYLDGKPFDTRDLAEIGKNIAKYSFNLIDLVEVDDFVNDYKVIEVTDEYIKLDKQVYHDGKYESVCILKVESSKNFIHSIVTKERFERAKYIGGDEE